MYIIYLSFMLNNVKTRAMECRIITILYTNKNEDHFLYPLNMEKWRRVLNSQQACLQFFLRGGARGGVSFHRPWTVKAFPQMCPTGHKRNTKYENT